MSKTLGQLKSLWDREKDAYRTQEVGSGIHRFVRDVLECTDIFKLKEGNLSTLTERRRNEFIYEKRTKDRRRADFVIYVNPNIVIPFEAEQYTNIEEGTHQIAQYQTSYHEGL